MFHIGAKEKYIVSKKLLYQQFFLHSNQIHQFIEKYGVCLLDGAMGTALYDGHAQKDVLWGSQVLMTDDGLKELEKIHMSFLNNGSQVISTNSYKISHLLLNNLDFFNTNSLAPNISTDEEKYNYTTELLKRSVEIAKISRDKYMEKNKEKDLLFPLVAASVGPCGESTPFSGMTDPSNRVIEISDDILYQYYYDKLKSLYKGEPDLFAIETLPGINEATVALDVLQNECEDAKTWISFICKDNKTTIDGSIFKDAVAKVAAYDNVIAVGINCVHPSLVQPLLTSAKEVTDKPLVCYPNSGEVWDAREGHRCWVDDEEKDAVPILNGTHALEFKSYGASLIGGCCRVRAGQIGEFKEALLQNYDNK